MRIGKLKEIIDDIELLAAVMGNNPKTTKITKQEILTNLFLSKGKETLLKQFTKKIKHNISYKRHKTTCKKIYRLLKGIKRKKTISFESKSAFPLDRFPQEKTLLKNLREKASILSEDSYAKSLEVIRDINRRVTFDPYAKKRTSRNSTLPPRSDEVSTPNKKYLLIGCPKTIEDARQLFRYVLRNHCVLMISLLGKEEGENRANNFWTSKMLKHISPVDDWTIEQKSSQVFAQSLSSVNEVGKHPELIRTELVATKGEKQRTITHLHYDGWMDRSPLPDEHLFSTLLDTARQLSPSKEVPISINCMGGVGRTGTTAVTLYLQKQIDDQLAAGKNWDEITINVAEAIYYFRKFRIGIVGQPSHYAQMHSVLADYVDIKLQQISQGTSSSTQ